MIKTDLISIISWIKDHDAILGFTPEIIADAMTEDLPNILQELPKQFTTQSNNVEHPYQMCVLCDWHYYEDACRGCQDRCDWKPKKEMIEFAKDYYTSQLKNEISKYLKWMEELQEQNIEFMKEHLNDGDMYRLGEDLDKIAVTRGKIAILSVILNKDDQDKTVLK